MPEFKIGQAVDIISEEGVIRKSSIQDLVDDRIVFLQITPPLFESAVGKIMVVTYVSPGDRCSRFRFQVRIVEVREGYVTVGRGFPVIITVRVSPCERCDRRAYERHSPEPAMCIKYGSDDLEIINISTVGAHLVRMAPKRSPLKVDDAVLLTIRNHDETYSRQARIVRRWHSRGESGPEHFAVVFLPKTLR